MIVRKVPPDESVYCVSSTMALAPGSNLPSLMSTSIRAQT
jgi:hypothetical protein